MNVYDVAIIGVGLIGLVLWLRGCFRRSFSDGIMGLVLGTIACGLYFFLFSLTRTAWLPVMIFASFLATSLVFGAMRKSFRGRILTASVMVLTAAVGIAEYKYVSAGNACHFSRTDPMRTDRMGFSDS